MQTIAAQRQTYSSSCTSIKYMNSLNGCTLQQDQLCSRRYHCYLCIVCCTPSNQYNVTVHWIYYEIICEHSANGIAHLCHHLSRWVPSALVNNYIIFNNFGLYSQSHLKFNYSQSSAMIHEKLHFLSVQPIMSKIYCVSNSFL